MAPSKFVLEWMKCKNSFDYYCGRYVKIEMPGGDILLNPYQRQSELIQKLIKEKFVLTLKSRQIGISTIIKAFTSWLCVFHDNVVIGIISKDGPESTDFARGIIDIIDKLPSWMRPKFKKKTERTFILSNGSKCYASPVNPLAPEKTLRGKAITFLVIDEAAFIKHVDIAWTSLVPALSTNQMHARMNGVPYGTILLSTPNKTTGVGQWFYQKYCDSESRTSSFIPEVIHWKQIPELVNDPLWYINICNLLDNNKAKINQELELKFLPSEGAFFDAETNMKLQDSAETPSDVMKLFNGEVWKFADPVPGRFYIHGVDTAPEHGHDRSAHVIFDYETLEQVWEYNGKCRIEDFIKIIKLGLHNYPGVVVIESNSYGNQVIEALDRDPLYMMMVYKEKRKTGKTIKHIPGVSTNIQTRPLMIDSLYTYVTQFTECIKSKRLQLELIGLSSKTSGKVEAETGGFDDIALASSFCYYVRKYDPPRFLDFAQSQETIDDLKDIVGMNEMDIDFRDEKSMNRYIKENLFMNNDKNHNVQTDILGLSDIFGFTRK